MSRQVVLDEDGETAGWFDPYNSADVLQDGTRWDGNDHVGLNSGSQWVEEYLYRTKSGRWVRCSDAYRLNNGRVTYRFITDDEARLWLITAELHDDLERLFPDTSTEVGPGRPEIGPAVKVRLPQDLLDRVDAAADFSSVSRAEMIRQLVTSGLG